jgi:hypothetical protein
VREKAIKALWFAEDAAPWGHSVQKLLGDLPIRDRLADPAAAQRRAIELDRLHIPTRYPNGIPDLTPGHEKAQEAQNPPLVLSVPLCGQAPSFRGFRVFREQHGQFRRFEAETGTLDTGSIAL